MSLSMFDLFKIGIGPSSSHTVGPMVAARRFIDQLGEGGLLDQTARMRVQLYGSLAMTGKGHATDIAVILGLNGERPESVDPDAVQSIVDDIRTRGTIKLGSGREVAFDPEQDLRFNLGVSLPAHPNGLRFEALDEAGIQIAQLECYSVGGGFVLAADEVDNPTTEDGPSEPWPFNYAEELMSLAEREGLTIAELMLANEEARTPPEEVRPRLLQIWKVMDEAIHRGCSNTGELPGGLHVRRRAHELCRELMDKPKKAHVDDHLEVLDWVNLYALAVNEENAAGGRVVTAPTNGAAGVIPAVLAYYDRFVPGSNEEGVIGVACSMAAGALCAVLGGTVRQIENAAEIGMEHNLGLTCDPIAGLVQVPCIERNTMGAVKAINAARLALRGDGKHFVSLDSVIETMRQTGADMQDKYKETSTGGLAVNVVAC
ncbi:MAG: L-serine ammonia-lyase [Oceanospirillales bacterium]|nr:L-serine ammonia-lyase [Oceanospirillales bacterium]